MSIIVSEELKAYIDPLTPEEHDALERSLLAEGCRDALVLWGDLLIDGHNRYGICQKHGIPFQTVQHPHFKTMDDVHLWMIDQHLGRRSVSDFQRGVLALRKREILAQRQAQTQTQTHGQPTAPRASETASDGQPLAPTRPDEVASVATSSPLKSRADIARAARLSANQVVLIEKIQTQAVPELVAAVKQGTISINAAAAVATLPADEQKAAAIAGKDELKQLAKRVREVKRKPSPAQDTDGAAGETAAPEASAADDLLTLRAQVAALRAENAALRAELAALKAQAGV